MTRLCGLNPMIDYTPVKWALRQTVPGGDPPRARATMEAETTVTAYESLADDERAALLLLNAECRFRFSDGSWTIRIDLKGSRYQFAFQAARGYTMKEFIGYLLDHGHCPSLHHPQNPDLVFNWRDP